MVNYECKKCGKIFDRKSSYDNHVNKRKNPCINKKLNDHNKIDELSDNSDSSSISEKSYENIFLDENLKKIKSTKKKEKEILVKENLLEKLIEDNKILKEDNKNLNKKLEELQVSVKKIEGAVSNITNNYNINITNVQLNSFGREDFSKIPLTCFTEPMRRIKNGKKIFREITRNLYFNPEFPENQTVYCEDIEEEKYKIYNSRKKKFVKTNIDVIHKLIGRLIEFCYEKKEEFNCNEFFDEELDVRVSNYINNKMKLIKQLEMAHENTILLEEDQHFLFDTDEKNAGEFYKQVRESLKKLLFKGKGQVLENFDEFNIEN